MALRIETFNNLTGGNAFFKAVGHPLARAKIEALVARLAARGPCALYDSARVRARLRRPSSAHRIALDGVFVQKLEDVGNKPLGHVAAAGDRLGRRERQDASSSSRSTPARLVDHVRHLRARGHRDRDPRRGQARRGHAHQPEALSRPAQFRDQFRVLPRQGRAPHAPGHRQLLGRLWRAAASTLWLTLFDGAGAIVAEWREARPRRASASIAIDSRVVRANASASARFTGQLFIHAIGAAGPRRRQIRARYLRRRRRRCLSCTHDANSWPADRLCRPAGAARRASG